MKKLSINSKIRVHPALALVAGAVMVVTLFNFRGTRPATAEDVVDVLAYLQKVAASGELERVSKERRGSYIQCADGAWLIGWYHSLHVNDGVDDFAVVLTSAGDAYFTQQHFCAPGGLGRVTAEDLANVTEFFEKTQDEHPWMKLGKLDP